MSKLLFNSILVIVGCIVLYFLAQKMIDEQKVPSLQSFLASSTLMNTSSTSELITNNGSSTLDTFTSSSTFGPSTFIAFIKALASSTQTNSNSTRDATSSYLSLISLPTTSIFTHTGSMKVFIAGTDVAQQQGLSDIPLLPDGVGMLFVFNQPGQYSFWMKDMHFPLDLVWIDKDKIVSDITRNALPSSYPSTFTPISPIIYVLEINAGTASRFGFTKGSTVKFILP